MREIMSNKGLTFESLKKELVVRLNLIDPRRFLALDYLLVPLLWRHISS